MTISGEAQESSYGVAEILTWNEIIIAESVSLRECCKILNIVFGEEYEKETLKIPVR
jgi:hypothetical protein